MAVTARTMWLQVPTTGVPDTTIVGDPVEFTVGSVLGALALACVAAIPIGISLWALLDAARRPRWAWALSGRRQVVWMALILAGMLSVIGGLLIGGYYLTTVRRQLVDAESGRF